MINPIKRQSVAAQICDAIRQELLRGRWNDWLPGERHLGEQMQVSRTTIRLALAQLKKEGLIQSVHGRGTRALQHPSPPTLAIKDAHVAMLLPGPLEQMRPTQTLWIDELRSMLGERGHCLHIFHGNNYFSLRPGRALAKLTRRYPHSCWVLVNCHAAMQRWFFVNQVPSIVAGTPIPGIELPFVDIDHAALCRHAVGRVLAIGHRNVAFLIRQSGQGGDNESERGFLEGIAQVGPVRPTMQILHHRDTADHVDTIIRRTMSQRHRPTAILVAHPQYYLTVISRLAQLRLRVPGDVSVVSRDDDYYLSFLRPAPTRYYVQPLTLARHRLRAVLDLIENNGLAHTHKIIIPEFIPGGTLTPPAK